MVPLVIGEEIWYFPFLERGMDRAKELIKLYPRTAHGRILWIGEVLKAKGRFQRRWYANKGGLWLVLSLYDELLPDRDGLLGIAVGLALVRAVKSIGGEKVFLKWINDLHYHGRKLAGVLMERWKEWIIIGIGLNVNNNPPAHLPAISLKELLKKECSLKEILALFVEYFNYYYQILWSLDIDLYYEEKTLNPIIEDFNKYSDTLGRCVYYHYNVEEEGGLIGRAIALDPQGALLIESEGEILKVTTGEILYLS